MSSLTLYHYWRSSASWRVRWALEIKGLSWESRHIDLLKGEEKKPEYIGKNPAGYLPCLAVGERLIAESLPIMEWLEENYPQQSLLPGDSFQRALIRQLAETVNSGIQPLINLDITKHVSSDKLQQTKWSQHWLRRGLAVLEDLLVKLPTRSAPFAFGDSPTMADICLIPQCYSAERNELDLQHYPRLNSIYRHALQTDACQRAHPDRYKPA